MLCFSCQLSPSLIDGATELRKKFQKDRILCKNISEVINKIILSLMRNSDILRKFFFQ